MKPNRSLGLDVELSDTNNPSDKKRLVLIGNKTDHQNLQDIYNDLMFLLKNPSN
jgi:GTPase SAR1 family protein